MRMLWQIKLRQMVDSAWHEIPSLFSNEGIYMDRAELEQNCSPIAPITRYD